MLDCLLFLPKGTMNIGKKKKEREVGGCGNKNIEKEDKKRVTKNVVSSFQPSPIGPARSNLVGLRKPKPLE